MNQLQCFYQWQQGLEEDRCENGSLLVGYVLETGYDSFVISTNTALQASAGPLSRGCFLLAMAGEDTALLLRVAEVVSSPLKSLEHMTMYELGKRAMPAMDQLTVTDMSWSCCRCDILGSFYSLEDRICFAGDLLRLSAPSDYRVYNAGNLLPLIVSGEYARFQDGSGILRATEYNGFSSDFVPTGDFCSIGFYRPTELLQATQYYPDANLYLRDIAGRRTALFGKTRSGKSNTVKIIAAALLCHNRCTGQLGQLVIDTNGEYANDNPQDGTCLCSRFPNDCVVYSILPKPGSGARVLRSNFYLCPQQAMTVLADALADNKANYVTAFRSVPIPSLEELRAMAQSGDRIRAIRRVQMFWAALHKAGYPADEAMLEASAPKQGTSVFDPCFSRELREEIRGRGTPPPDSLASLCAELEALYRLYQQDSKHRLLQTASGNPLLEPDDLNLLQFLFPSAISSGTKVLSCCRYLHHKNAGDILAEIPALLDQSKMVVLDLSNGTPALIRYLTQQICSQVFHHQEELFTKNLLGDHYVQLYVEEAHNYFPTKDTDNTDIFSRIAKEGAKYHMGLIYATQSPSTISGELLSQTENFVVAHLDSAHEVDALVKRSAPFAGVRENILRTRTSGYVHLLTASQRYPVPVQINSFRNLEVI